MAPFYFQAYLRAIRAVYRARGTEGSFRTAFQNFLEGVIGERHLAAQILHEPKRAGTLGAPDFRITNTESLIGYIETKKPGENLAAHIHSEQIQKYQQLSANILLTNYTEFVWIYKGAVQTANLGNAIDVLTAQHPAMEHIDAVEKLLLHFFSVPAKGLCKVQDLVKALAPRARLLRDFFVPTLQEQISQQKGLLYGIYEGFKGQVFKELKPSEFADVFAQMIVYGLFLGRLQSTRSEPLTPTNIDGYIPRNFALIRELIQLLGHLDDEAYQPIQWVIAEIFDIINAFDLEAIHQELSFHKPRNSQEEAIHIKDPYVYFYEDFLKGYDNELRRSMGVYYTPLPLVQFMVRGVDSLLRKEFGLKDGLAHENVTALDFATGTGTFLVEMFRTVLDSLPAQSGKRNLVIKNHLLKHFYGFEYMIAPYTIAHLKLSEFLKENGYTFEPQERVGVFLTNTLESTLSEKEAPLLFSSLSKEKVEAQRIKDKELLVIIGNPPYNCESRTKTPGLLDAYKQIDGVPLKERNPKTLNDDYVKFIRFAQQKMDQVKEGIVAVVTNNAFLDNVTFRGMRASLLKTFDQIKILNLHGNARKKEKAPDGGKDENVFGIQLGTCITFFVKNPQGEKGVFYEEVFGKQSEKFRYLQSYTLEDLSFNALDINNPPYYLVPFQGFTNYQQFCDLKGIFQIYNSSIKTDRDKMAIGFTPEELRTRFDEVARLAPQEVRQKYQPGAKERDREIEMVQAYLKTCASYCMEKILYRPFDTRYTEYTGKPGLIARPRCGVMQHMLAGENTGLIASRTTSPSMLCSSYLSHRHLLNGGSSLFPLYLYHGKPLSSSIEKTENFKPEFRAYIDDLYQHHYTPEEIVGYIYGVVYSPFYQNKYKDDLSKEFARIPFVDSRSLFEEMAALGGELIQTHLEKTDPHYGFGAFIGGGDCEVKAVSYNAQQERVYINPGQYFDHVPANIIDFKIGSYPVILKYLKCRKGRRLSLEEVNHVEKVVNILAFTIEQIKKIDAVYQEIDKRV